MRVPCSIPALFLFAACGGPAEVPQAAGSWEGDKKDAPKAAEVKEVDNRVKWSLSNSGFAPGQQASATIAIAVQTPDGEIENHEIGTYPGTCKAETLAPAGEKYDAGLSCWWFDANNHIRVKLDGTAIKVFHSTDEDPEQATFAALGDGVTLPEGLEIVHVK